MANDQGSVQPEWQAWPAVTLEQHSWRSGLPPGYGSAAARRRHDGPYDAAVVPRIADREVRLSTATFAVAEEASAEIARFDAEMGADAAPFGAVLLRSESASSSQIENLTSGARAIALAELGEQATANAGLVVANVRAMQAAIDLADRLDEAAVIAMHAALLGESHPGSTGGWRTEQVWVGGTGYGPHEADFVAPHHDRVPAAMADLVAFMRRDDIPALVHAAVAHAQFETIHPFTDGNGRTGRALVHAMLRARELTRHVTVPVSAGLLADTGEYFDALTTYRRGEPEPLVTLLAGATFAAIVNGRFLVTELREAHARWTDRLTARRDSVARPLAALLLRQPVLNVDMVRRELGVSDTAAYRAVDQLVAAGALRPAGGRRRNQVWQSDDVLAALDAFARRAGRRRLG